MYVVPNPSSRGQHEVLAVIFNKKLFSNTKMVYLEKE